MVSVGVIGASGYTGGELFRLLVNHPDVELAGAYDVKNVGSPLRRVHPNLGKSVDLTIRKPDYVKIAERTDFVFTATPHGVAMRFVPKLLGGGAKVVDLSADYRFADPKVFERYYVKHESPQLRAVYGLPELHRDRIKRAKLVANPGCYPVAAILGLAPLVREGLIDLEHVVVNAMSGTSGAGAELSEATHHPICGANVGAYALTTHRHAPEIDQELSGIARKEVRVHFTPHLVPIVRGILMTAQVFLRKRVSRENLLELYRKFYSNEPFVRVLEEIPQVNFVVGSNYCDIGLEPDARSNRLVVVSAIDNLIKGASGQAIQNMNLMIGVDESRGLEALPMRP